MKAAPALNNLRFAPCMSSLWLLITLPEMAGRAVAAGSRVVSLAGLSGCADFRPTPMNKMNLRRREVCRGRISLQKKSTHLEERTHQRQSNE
jgi:hypothetical protein